ncbi:MAG: hypothetical protein V2A65_09520 [Candidatus Omnitrophota bacterium]
MKRLSVIVGVLAVFMLTSPNVRAAEVPLERTEGLPASSVVNFQNADFTIYKEGDLSGRMVDKDAPSGSYAWLLGTTPEWAIQCPIPINLLSRGESYRVYAVVKVIKAKDAGDAFCCGIYDVDSKIELMRNYVSVKKVPAGWKTYAIGTIKAEGQSFVWFCGIEDGAASKILIDRIYLGAQEIESIQIQEQ